MQKQAVVRERGTHGRQKEKARRLGGQMERSVISGAVSGNRSGRRHIGWLDYCDVILGVFFLNRREEHCG